ncbi:MAG: helix-turn-helix domain-containing protein [Limisphaerales bacterium]
MKTKTEEFEILIPNLDGTDIAERVKVPVTLEWDEEVKQWLLTPEAHQIIEDTKARRIGLLLPAQLKELRDRYDYTQKEMGELFQVGEKSWTRWESGRHRPSRSINLLIRALYEGQISINYLLKRAGKVVEDHRQRGRPLAVWRNGEVVWMPVETADALRETPPAYQTKKKKR